ncbi:hypothetical protein LINGRAHAP2_LOCUS31537 [Linum grandiflorum]
MATLRPSDLRFRKALWLCLFLFFFLTSLFLSSASSSSDNDFDEQPLPKKKPTTSSSLSATKNKPTTTSQKNQTTSKNSDSLSSSSAKNQTKLLKTGKSSNSTKLASTTNSSSDPKKTTAATSELKLKNKSTTNSTNDSSSPHLVKQKDKKQLNSTATKTKIKTKTVTDSDPIKPSPGSSKNKTTSKLPTAKKSQTLTPDSDSTDKKKKQTTTKSAAPVTKKLRIPSSWIEPDEEEEGDLVSEFRDLPSKFQQHLIPDLERISMTSRKYLTQANKEMTRGFKPIVGNKYAATIASVVSFAFILIPLLLVSLIVNRIKAYFSLQKLLIFVQVYLSIYFSILCLSSLATGLEPLRFFYASAGSTYFGIMLLQTLAYLFYLFLLLVYLVLVFSPSSAGMGTKMMGLAQVLTGFAIGVHLYVAVFHRVLLHQPPKTNWKVHGIYAACFLVVSLLAGAERRKKAYLEEGGEQGKLN